MQPHVLYNDIRNSTVAPMLFNVGQKHYVGVHNLDSISNEILFLTKKSIIHLGNCKLYGLH